METWHQYPPNDFIDKQQLYDADFLYISHHHLDHFDREFLGGFPKDKVTILIADFITDSFKEEIVELGFPRVIRVKDWEQERLAENFSVSIIRQQALYMIDSMLIVWAGDTVLVNRNDCALPPALYDRFRNLHIDVFFSQFSGAFYFPACYDYPPERKKELSAGIRKDLLNRFVEQTNSITPANVVPFAGPPCFLEDRIFDLNFLPNGIFHDQHDVEEEIKVRVDAPIHTVLPGDILTFDEHKKLQLQRVRDFDFSKKKEFLREYQKQRLPIIEDYLKNLAPARPGLMDEFEIYIARLLNSNDYIRRQSSCLFAFHVTGEHGGWIYFDTRDEYLKVTRETIEAPNYTLTLASDIAQLLVVKNTIFEDFLLSLRFTAHRDPDVYNWPFFALLRFGHEQILIDELEKIMAGATRETTVVKDGKTSYRIQKYCPHAGEDLSFASLENGIMICPRHRWTFDLKAGGKCIKGGNIPVHVYDVTEEAEEESW